MGDKIKEYRDIPVSDNTFIRVYHDRADGLFLCEYLKDTDGTITWYDNRKTIFIEDNKSDEQIKSFIVK